jgi:hypothetical protein
MVIQDNMPVSGIVTTWKETQPVLDKYGISSNTNKTLMELLSGDILENLLRET